MLITRARLNERHKSHYMSISLKHLKIDVEVLHRNLSPAVLYERALRFERGSMITSSGALAITSGKKTGRSPQDKRIVQHPHSEADVDWGKINIPMSEHVFDINHERAIDYLNTRDELYIVDGLAGWDPRYQIKVRVVCSRAYHALFMHNMLIRPTVEQLADFGEPDYLILNAGHFPANPYTDQMTSATSIDFSFERKTIVILGTEYAGEMKKGVFTVLNYLMPKQDVLPMHCSINEGEDESVTVFFGLSGTGKTTLSTEQSRKLIGDDEHCWSDEGVFNIEGGCYAKCIDLDPTKETEIYDAIRFGTLLENIVCDPYTREVDYSDCSLTQNTRASYPIDYIANAKLPCVGGHPNNIVFLTCDAFGVLPPVSALTPEQASYHFISGYTAKVAGTEQGVSEPQAIFSACFGAAFMVWNPVVYATLLAEKMKKHDTKAWLVNTGWIAGAYGTGRRMELRHTRGIVRAINTGALADIDTEVEPIFNLAIPKSCPGVPNELLMPRNLWKEAAEYDKKVRALALLFHENFKQFAESCDESIKNAGPNR